jgi:hypothetical protein
VCDLKLSLYLAGFVRFGPQNIVCLKFAKVSLPFRGNFIRNRVNPASYAIITGNLRRSRDG